MGPVEPLRSGTFRRDERGVAAVEFALVLPVLVMLFFGVTELSERLGVRWDVQAYNYQIGDFLSRASDLEAVDFDDVYGLREEVMQTISPASSVAFRIVSVGYDTSGAPVLLWDETRGASPPTFALADAAGLGVHGQSVIFSVTSVSSPRTFNYFGRGQSIITKQTFFRPRITRAIALNGSLTEGGITVEGYY